MGITDSRPRKTTCETRGGKVRAVSVSVWVKKKCGEYILPDGFTFEVPTKDVECNLPTNVWVQLCDMFQAVGRKEMDVETLVEIAETGFKDFGTLYYVPSRKYHKFVFVNCNSSLKWADALAEPLPEGYPVATVSKCREQPHRSFEDLVRIDESEREEKIFRQSIDELPLALDCFDELELVYDSWQQSS